jgi:DNA-binding NarL/FixJ family response regulator
MPEPVTGRWGVETGSAGAAGVPVVVSIIDDHPDLCYGVLARLPQENSSFAGGVMAATVPEFLALEADTARRSDVVLLDLNLKDESSPPDNVARLKDAGYPVVIYTGEERPERLHGTLGIGADALVRKDEADCLEAALTAVVSGDHGWVSPLMASVVLAAPGPRLSPAQVEVLRLYATGVPAQRIASLQGCALDTVKTHLKAVKIRYEAHGDAVFTRTDLLRVAIRDRHVGQDWYLLDSETGDGSG